MGGLRGGGFDNDGGFKARDFSRKEFGRNGGFVKGGGFPMSLRRLRLIGGGENGLFFGKFMTKSNTA